MLRKLQTSPYSLYYSTAKMHGNLLSALRSGKLSPDERIAILSKTMNGLYEEAESGLGGYFFEYMNLIPEADRRSFYEKEIASQQVQPENVNTVVKFDFVLLTYFPECDHEPYLNKKYGSLKAWFEFSNGVLQDDSALKQLRHHCFQGGSFTRQLPNSYDFLIATMINVFYWANFHRSSTLSASNAWLYSTERNIKASSTFKDIRSELIAFTRSLLIKPIDGFFDSAPPTLSIILNEFCPRGAEADLVDYVITHQPESWLSEELSNPGRFSLNTNGLTGTVFLDIFLGKLIECQGQKPVSISCRLVLNLFKSKLVDAMTPQKRAGGYLSVSQLIETPIFRKLISDRLCNIPIEHYKNTTNPALVVKCTLKHFGDARFGNWLVLGRLNEVVMLLKPDDKAAFQDLYLVMLNEANRSHYTKEQKAGYYLQVFTWIPASHQAAFLKTEVNDRQFLQDVIADNYSYASLYQPPLWMGDLLLSGVKKLVEYYRVTGDTNDILVRLLAGLQGSSNPSQLTAVLDKFQPDKMEVEEVEIEDEQPVLRRLRY